MLVYKMLMDLKKRQKAFANRKWEVWLLLAER